MVYQPKKSPQRRCCGLRKTGQVAKSCYKAVVVSCCCYAVITCFHRHCMALNTSVVCLKVLYKAVLVLIYKDI